MTVLQAREAARQYVQQVALSDPNLKGAYLSGSILSHALSDLLSQTSDVDLVLIYENAQELQKPGKQRFRGFLLEPSLLDSQMFSDHDTLLTTHYLGYALSKDAILYDPDGILAQAQQTIRAEYHKPIWVNRRIDQMLELIRSRAEHFDPAASLPDRITSFFFTVSLAVYPILLAAGENLTVRKRYAASRPIFAQYGYDSLYTSLLFLLTNNLSAERCLFHMAQLEQTFDLAARSDGPSQSFAFRSDISKDARTAAIDGCYELLHSDYPQEAIFWMGATFARCHTILLMDGSDARLPQFESFAQDIGLACSADFERRLARLFQLLPAVESAARLIAEKMEITTSR
jgi:hypothetical protein